MNPWRWLATTAVLVLGVVSWYGTSAGVAPEPLPSGRMPSTLAVQGAGSCSATACHGGTSPAAPDTYPSRKPILRNEHTTWITQDRHADAYRVLFSRRSREMATRLNQGKVPAHEDARCLACHATAGTVPTTLELSAAVVRSDGVGCESCHGAAERWLGAHTQAWWADQPESEKLARFGMRPTRALEARVAICVECHIGSPGRDVNHDLIAAGHPRLSFEFAAFLANMPPHWVEETGGNFPARAWLVGQVATARAAADLLAHRAGEASGERAPWPEFSEYDCFACHHDLADEVWRQARARAAPGHTPGSPAWGTWYYPQVWALARHPDRAAPPDLEPALAAVQSEMGRFGSDSAKVARAAHGLSDALRRWLQNLPDDTKALDPPRLKSLIANVRKDEPGSAPGWDSTAQRYLALQPLSLALKAMDPASSDRALESELQNLFRSLQYPPGYDSPRRYQPVLPAGNR